MDSSNNSGDVVHSEHGHIRLACQACQRKKIKCDRTFPCGQCLRSSLQCVPSHRKPRARHAGKRAVDSELRNRITKLESLVETLSGEVGVQEESPSQSDHEADQDHDNAQSPEVRGPSSPAVRKYIGSQFWSSLTTEVQALREVLEDDDHNDSPEQDTPTTSESAPDGAAPVEYDLLLCPPGMVYVMPGAFTEPTSQVQAALYGTFVENAAPMLGVFHVPTLKTFLTQETPYFGVDAQAPPCKALRAAIWYIAAHTMSDAEFQIRCGQVRSEALPRFRRMIELWLAQADLMNTSDMATMHAFVLYLVSLEPHHSSSYLDY